MNPDQIKQYVQMLVLDGRYSIEWRHIRQRGHRVEEYEIKTVLLHGRHAPDRDHPNRYNAFGTIPPKKIRVVYALVEQPDGMTVVVITAFED